MFVVHNRIRESPQIPAASRGDYTLNSAEFSYRCTDPATFTITPSGIAHAPTGGSAMTGFRVVDM